MQAKRNADSSNTNTNTNTNSNIIDLSRIDNICGNCTPSWKPNKISTANKEDVVAALAKIDRITLKMKHVIDKKEETIGPTFFGLVPIHQWDDGFWDALVYLGAKNASINQELKLVIDWCVQKVMDSLPGSSGAQALGLHLATSTDAMVWFVHVCLYL